MGEKMRLDKYLTACNVGSRQIVKTCIRKKRVKCNGEIISSPEFKIDSTEDKITLDNQPVCYEEFYYLMLNKPAGYVCSRDEKGQKSVMELIKEPYADKLFPVGRLDKDTEGLLLLTNDGKLDHNLRSPRKHVMKQYYVRLAKAVTPEQAALFENGLDIGDGKLTLPARLLPSEDACTVCVEITEGRYHQIKRMFEALDNKVLYLKRLRMKNLTLDETLGIGEYRKLTWEEQMNLTDSFE